MTFRHTVFAACVVITSAGAQASIAALQPFFAETQNGHGFTSHWTNLNTSVKSDRLSIQAVNRSFEIRFLDASEGEVQGAEKQLAVVNRYLGEATQWQTKQPTYAKVQTKNLYPGIDLEVMLPNGDLRFDFVVAPGVDPHQISLGFENVESATAVESGGISLRVDGVVVTIQPPIAYQLINGTKVAVAASYELSPEKQQADIRIGKYDQSHALVIDPTLTINQDFAHRGRIRSIGRDDSGSVYVAGDIQFEPIWSVVETACSTLFVAKVDRFGVARWINYYGSSLASRESECHLDLAVRPDGTTAALVNTTSSAFVLLEPFQNTLDSFSSLAITTFSSDGDLEWSTYFNANASWIATQLAFGSFGGIAWDDAGRLHLTGTTCTDLPTMRAIFPTRSPVGCDGFVAAITPRGGLYYSTYLGQETTFNDIAIGSDGSINVAGETRSSNYPLRNPLRDRPTSLASGVLSKLSADGQELLRSTYFGTPDREPSDSPLAMILIGQIALDNTGAAYLAGGFSESALPRVDPLERCTRGAEACSRGAFIAKLNPSWDNIEFSTGFNADIGIHSLKLDSLNNILISGTSRGPFATRDAVTSFQGTSQSFLAKIRSDGQELLFASPLPLGAKPVGCCGVIAMESDDAVWVGDHSSEGGLSGVFRLNGLTRRLPTPPAPAPFCIASSVAINTNFCRCTTYDDLRMMGCKWRSSTFEMERFIDWPLAAGEEGTIRWEVTAIEPISRVKIVERFPENLLNPLNQTGRTKLVLRDLAVGQTVSAETKVVALDGNGIHFGKARLVWDDDEAGFMQTQFDVLPRGYTVEAPNGN